jgi:hypothetical protein
MLKMIYVEEVRQVAGRQHGWKCLQEMWPVGDISWPASFVAK